MNFHVLTLFPDMIIDGLNTSITGRAIKNGCLSVEAVNIRDYANNKHMKVDDYPYGGGAGLVMQAAARAGKYDLSAKTFDELAGGREGSEADYYRQRAADVRELEKQAKAEAAKPAEEKK